MWVRFDMHETSKPSETSDVPVDTMLAKGMCTYKCAFTSVDEKIIDKTTKAKIGKSFPQYPTSKDPMVSLPI